MTKPSRRSFLALVGTGLVTATTQEPITRIRCRSVRRGIEKVVDDIVHGLRDPPTGGVLQLA